MFVRKGQRLGSILHQEDGPGPEPSPEKQAPEAPPGPSDEPKRPAQADLKDAWVDYAVAQGIERDDAEAMTKADLVELLKEDDDGDDDVP